MRGGLEVSSRYVEVRGLLGEIFLFPGFGRLLSWFVTHHGALVSKVRQAAALHSLVHRSWEGLWTSCVAARVRLDRTQIHKFWRAPSELR